MNYQETIQFLFSQLPVFQRDGASAYKANLDNTLALDNYFGRPHLKFKTIHIGGTNGKGSVSHMIAAVLQKAGYRTGLYTSPHLLDFRERIKINGQMIEEEEVVNFVRLHKEIINEIKPSFFELTVAMAFDYFAQKQVDIAVIEVGMGGRLDSTNIIHPDISVITNISLDHTQFLGNTLPLIAHEKAGIIKPNIPVIIGQHHPETDQVFINAAKRNGSELIFAQDFLSVSSWKTTHNGCEITLTDLDNKTLRTYELDLGGIYQQKNIITVLAALERLGKTYLISDFHIHEGIKNTVKLTGLKGRWQRLGINPLIICDTGHNEDGIKQVISQVKLMEFDHLHVILGMVNDKDHSKVLKLLPQNATYYFTRASIPRALPESELMHMAFKFGLKGDCYPNVTKALAAAKESGKPNDLIFVGGSTFIVAELPGL